MRNCQRFPTPPIRIEEAFLSAELIRDVYQVFKHLTLPASFFYLELARLNHPDCLKDLIQYFPLGVAHFLLYYFRKLLRITAGMEANGAHGIEFWIRQKHKSEDQRVFLHTDNDEVLRKNAGTLRKPMLGTIMHIGPDSGLIGGETLFLPAAQPVTRSLELFRFYEWDELRTRAWNPILVGQRAGRLVLFPGDIPHAVGPVVDNPKDSPRVALLVNFWSSRISGVPQGLCRFDPSIVVGKGNDTA